MTDANMNKIISLLERLDQRMTALEGKVGGGAGDDDAADSGEGTPKRVTTFQETVLNKMEDMEKAANEIGQEIQALMQTVRDVFQEQVKFLELSAKCKKPAQSDLPSLIKGLQNAKKKADDAKFNYKGKELESHATAVSDGIQVAQWVITDSLPHQVVESYQDAAVFSLNRIKKNFKGQTAHIEWCKAFEGLLKNLLQYVKDNFKTGLTWNPNGSSATEHQPTATATSANAAAGSRPPPTKSSSEAGAPTVHNVFEELKTIDQSSGKTAGLRHVTKDMKTKNQKDKPAHVSETKQKAATERKKNEAAKPKKPPRTELVSKRWFVENHVDLEEPVRMDNLELMQEVYISDCENATIILSGKCKAMQINKCKKCKILCDTLISSCELVDCQRCQVQVQKVPSLSVDKTDGLVVFLPYQSRDTQIVTSKCSEVNISFPKGPEEEADWIELPVPEQFTSRITEDNQIQTGVSDLYQ
eukprot:gb/GECG01014827.1/.p1 GENE.gb/GECG01014827.1/~~gb/GECG01014827.1/.p1  ORF type:complete len:472 (+),score=79.15 gb/GECG01014827.1/:1-1416(+)